MPENITDVDTFTDPVQVPLDGEFATNASLKLFVQALSNRTRNAKNRLDTIFTRVGDMVLGIGSDFSSLKTTLQNTNFGWSGLHNFPQGNVTFTGGAQARLVPVALSDYYVSQASVNKVQFTATNGLETVDNGVAAVRIPLNLRHGLTIKSLTVHASRFSATSALEIHIERLAPGTAGNPNVATSLASIVKTTTTAEVLTTSPDIAEVVDPQNTYYLRVEPPLGADRVYWAWINCTRDSPFLGA